MPELTFIACDRRHYGSTQSVDVRGGSGIDFVGIHGNIREDGRHDTAESNVCFFLIYVSIRNQNVL